ncbi:hypothetical protein C0989_004255 [Termitomyces sp. Mn162]|nr:hypothetical protein C0989_004255 [Termitomyces sp. Mn162]
MPAYSAKQGTSRSWDGNWKLKGENPKYKKQNERKQLTKEEETEYHAQNKCFNCGQLGHMSRNCPSGRSASSSTPGKPPGLKSYSVQVDLREMDRLREEALGQTTAGITVGMVTLSTNRNDTFIIKGDSPSLIEHLEENLDNSSADTADRVERECDNLPDSMEVLEGGAAQPVEDDDITEGPSTPTSDRYSEDEESYMDSHTNVCLDLELNIDIENPVNVDTIEDYYDEVYLTTEQDFGQESYDFVVSNTEERMELVWKEEIMFGRPNQIGCAAAQKLDFLLERLQPYPGDPSNVLQLKGRRFYSYEIAGGNLCLWDHIWDRELIIPADVVAHEGFAAGMWYAIECSNQIGLPVTRLSWYKTTLAKNVWAWNAAKILELGAPYLDNEHHLDTSHGKRFDLIQRKPGEWVIMDHQLRFITRIEENHLKNPLFNLCHWYLIRIKQVYDSTGEGSETNNDDRKPCLGTLTLPLKGPHTLEREIRMLLEPASARYRQHQGDRDPDETCMISKLEVNGQQVE